jgi:protein-tyrosine phosphatase
MTISSPSESHPRRIILEGSTNFRDLGGYETRDGRRLRMGRLYRSDLLHRLTPHDIETLNRLNIGAICDFRYAPEREEEPSPPIGTPPAQVVHLGLPMRPDYRFLDWLAEGTMNAEKALEGMFETYRSYPRLYAPSYRRLVDIILESDDRAVLFHCTAGKDRTGFAAAVLMLALGVPLEHVEADYLHTNECWRPETYIPATIPADVVAVVAKARPEYLHTAFEAIREDYGSVEAYLERGVGLTSKTLEALRAHLLE